MAGLGEANRGRPRMSKCRRGEAARREVRLLKRSPAYTESTGMRGASAFAKGVSVNVVRSVLKSECPCPWPLFPYTVISQHVVLSGTKVSPTLRGEHVSQLAP